MATSAEVSIAMAAAEYDKERIPYHRYAFRNLYNYTLLAGVGAAALLTGQWWMLIFGGAAEALWMLFAPDSRLRNRRCGARRTASLARRSGRHPPDDPV